MAPSLKCLRRHQKSGRLCGRGYICPKCKRFISQGGGKNRVNREDVLAAHVCNSVTCRLCREKYHENETHICPMQSQKQQTYYCNLGFFDFEALQPDAVSNCFDCMQQKKRYLEQNWKEAKARGRLRTIMCDRHKDDEACPPRAYHEANYCTCLFEDSERGHFSLVTFADPDMQHPKDCTIQKDYLVLDSYLPEDEPNTLYHDNKKCSNFAGNIRSSKIILPHRMQVGPLVQETSDTFDTFFMDDEADEDSDSDDDDDDDDNDDDVDADSARDFDADGEKGSHTRMNAGEANVDMDLLRSYNVLEKFWIFFSQPRFRNYTLLAHNASGYDSVHLSRSAFANGLTPSVVTRGNKILSMTIPSLNLVIIDSLQYAHTSLSKLAARYGLSQKGHFPHHFNKAENYTYRGNVPPIEAFCGEGSTEKQREEISTYVKSLEGEVWDFKDEIHKYCLLDTEILCKAMTLFIKEWFDIQNIFLQYFPQLPREESRKRLLHPFTAPFITFSGFIYGCYRLFESPNYNLSVINDEKGCTSVKTSQGEMEYVLYEFRRRNFPQEFYSSFTSRQPQRLGRIVPDYYFPSEQRAGFFHGCIFHGHLESNCPIVPPNSGFHTENFLGKKFGALQRDFERQCQELKQCHNVKCIDVMWECEWESLKRGELSGQPPFFSEIPDFPVKKHVEQLSHSRPLRRLSPRVALRGGRVDTFQFLWTKESNPGHSLHYIDYNSL